MIPTSTGRAGLELRSVVQIGLYRDRQHPILGRSGLTVVGELA